MRSREKWIFCLVICLMMSAYNVSAQNQYQGQSAAGQQPAVNQQSQYAPAQQTNQQLTPREQAVQAQIDLENALGKSFQQPQRPFPELSPADTQYLEQFLEYWEQSSEKVNQYVCEFNRYKYDTELVNYRDPQTGQLAACSIATGEIRFAKPDKGRYDTLKIFNFESPPKEPGMQAKFKQSEGDTQKERWICDGRNIYQFDFKNKRLYESEIPKKMQGERIIDSPLPFLFGANKQHILERYWVQIIPKQNANQQTPENEIWLEAYPKRIEDARLYSRIEVVIDRNDFLPKAMHLYSPQYDPKKNNFQSQYFSFNNRKVNSQLDKIRDFFGHFVRPQTPILGGWKRVSLDMLSKEQQAALPDGIKRQ